jgi:16S rRNA (guanine966-N2)-methyltransferase
MSQLRIIGGQWRGRKLTFTPADGLRPTTDRVRETLFNWLAPWLQGANCLDLFAGSGALGLEALSRGAARCDFVDSSRAAIQQIRIHLETLDANTRGNCFAQPAQDFLQSCSRSYDIVFIDPPFGRALAEPTVALLNQQRLLASDGMVYLETETSAVDLKLPSCWTLHRDKVAGAVDYRLYRLIDDEREQA